MYCLQGPGIQFIYCRAKQGNLICNIHRRFSRFCILEIAFVYLGLWYSQNTVIAIINIFVPFLIGYVWVYLTVMMIMYQECSDHDGTGQVFVIQVTMTTFFKSFILNTEYGSAG